MSNEAADNLRLAFDRLRHGHQPMYNGRPSCALCGTFVDGEETHAPGCLTTTNVLDEALRTERRMVVDQVREAMADEAFYIEDDEGNMLAYDEAARRLSVRLDEIGSAR